MCVSVCIAVALQGLGQYCPGLWWAYVLWTSTKWSDYLVVLGILGVPNILGVSLLMYSPFILVPIIGFGEAVSVCQMIQAISI